MYGHHEGETFIESILYPIKPPILQNRESRLPLKAWEYLVSILLLKIKIGIVNILFFQKKIYKVAETFGVKSKFCSMKILYKISEKNLRHKFNCFSRCGMSMVCMMVSAFLTIINDAVF